MIRRDFLTALGAAAVAACTSTDSGPVRRRLARIGLQLYTVRDLMAADFDATLAQVAEIGYAEVEFAGYFGRSPLEVAAALGQHGLVAPSSHVDYTTTSDAWQRTLDDAQAAGHTFVTVAWLPDEARDTLDAWRRTAAWFDELGEAARAAGLRFAYHNHDFEFTAADDVVPYDLLLAETDPGLVEFELDVYWITKAGFDAVAYLDLHPDRFVMTHLKDSGGPPDHAMLDVGSGTIDFDAVLAAAARANIEHHFVEHDAPADAIASIRASHDYLARRR